MFKFKNANGLVIADPRQGRIITEIKSKHIRDSKFIPMTDEVCILTEDGIDAYSAHTGELTRRLYACTDVYSVKSFSPNGSAFSIMDAGGHVFVIESGRVALSLISRSYTQASFSPDGKYFIVSSSRDDEDDEDCGVYVYDGQSYEFLREISNNLYADSFKFYNDSIVYVVHRIESARWNEDDEDDGVGELSRVFLDYIDDRYPKRFYEMNEVYTMNGEVYTVLPVPGENRIIVAGISDGIRTSVSVDVSTELEEILEFDFCHAVLSSDGTMVAVPLEDSIAVYSFPDLIKLSEFSTDKPWGMEFQDTYVVLM
jgi:WD40 repeat protein